MKPPPLPPDEAIKTAASSALDRIRTAEAVDDPLAAELARDDLDRALDALSARLRNRRLSSRALGSPAASGPEKSPQRAA